ncbi:glycosyltransferase family 4 protein [Dorea longicatena]|uniref:glycosyltransferase family 4 protein n=1 Tax=Dorea longicatena TaxID=88431 RepID=UPI001D092EDD|nr:glycosyltransferase family 4 protein [Dorea longicatena]MCB7408774.1 glycosyltransferase family 4 protein [Dorea longicatena]
MKKILYITNISNGVSSFSIAAVIVAKRLGIEFHLAGNFSGTEKEKLDQDRKKYGIQIHQVDLERSPYSPKNYKAYKQVVNIIRENKIEYIHCNTPIGGLLGRLAGKKCKVKKVIYQAHGFHFYGGAPKKNWLIYYPIEKWLAHYTDVLITINSADFKLAKSKLKLRRNGKVCYVHGVGIDLSKYIDLDDIRKKMRTKMNLNDSDVALISVGELNANKNNRIIIEAIEKLENEKIHYFLCGEGALEKELKELAEKKGVLDQVHFLEYRTDVKELLQAADVFVMPSIREGLSRSIMEAMASGLPCVVSRIRGNSDLIKDGEGGYLCETKNVEQYVNAINQLLSISLRKKMGKKNLERIKKYSMEIVQNELTTCYANIFGVHYE